MNEKVKKAYEIAKKLYGLFGVFYPVLVFYLKGKGIDLPPLGDWTMPVQVTGGLALAQSNKVVPKKESV